MADKSCTLHSDEVIRVCCVMTSVLPCHDWKYPLVIQHTSVCLFFFSSFSPLPDHVGDSQLSCDQPVD